jgi:hypothetical protein
MSFDGFVCFLLMESTFSFLGFVGFLARWSHCHFSTAPFFFVCHDATGPFSTGLGTTEGCERSRRDFVAGTIPRDRANIGTDFGKAYGESVNQW